MIGGTAHNHYHEIKGVGMKFQASTYLEICLIRSCCYYKALMTLNSEVRFCCQW